MVRRPHFTQLLAQQLQRVRRRGLRDLVATHHRDPVPAGQQLQVRPRRQETVPPHLLAANHTLKQTGTAAVVQPMKGRHRRHGIAQQTPIDRH